MKAETAKRFIVSLVLLAFLPALGFAQVAENSWDNLQQLRVGQRIRVVERNMKTRNGTFLSYSEDAISLRVGSDNIGIRRENVVRVSNREQSKRVRNAVIGAVGGAALGAVVGWSVGGHSGHVGDRGKITAGTTIGLGVVGAAIGASVASYQTIYRAP